MEKLDSNKVDRIIIHCSDTELTSSVDYEVIRSWHLARGFEDIGYHWIIYPNGFCHFGRSYSYKGAHTLGMNSRSIGICLIGGRSNGQIKDTRNLCQRVALSHLILDIVRSNMFPNIKYVFGHNDFSTRTCPNFDVQKEYQPYLDKILKELSSIN